MSCGQSCYVDIILSAVLGVTVFFALFQLTFAFSSLTYLLCMWMLNKIAASGLDVTVNQGTAGFVDWGLE